jgi:hypothetical protein
MDTKGKPNPGLENWKCEDDNNCSAQIAQVIVFQSNPGRGH